MYRDKRFLAIIPARSGSKGVKDKNIRPLHGKPLMQYSIEAARESGIMDRIFVSTDSPRYADIARAAGAEVPFLRPADIAGDRAVATDYLVHAIETYRTLGETFDYFALLQPTSPLRTGQDLSLIHI